jgi:alkylhydroperoxidase family enzyme
VELDDLSSLERAAMDFAAALVRMEQPPGAVERARFTALGLDEVQVAELAFAVAQVVASTRLTMLLAVQPDASFERMPDTFLLGRLLRPLLARGFRSERRPLAPVGGGPFAALLRPLGTTWGAQILRASLDALLGEGPVPARTKLLLILVLGAATRSPLLQDEAARLLAEAGVARETSAQVTAHLTSPALDSLEARLVPLARDTIHTRPIAIQQRMREATEGLAPRAVLDVAGALAVGNALARIATLAG